MKATEARRIEKEIATNINRAQWSSTKRPFHSREAFESAYKAVMESLGWKMDKAEYDAGGNCKTCGEAGRCEGWHIGGLES